MNPTISVTIKTVYGNEMIYPSCEDAKVFAKLTGKKTFSRADIAAIRELGYDVVVDQPTVSL